MNITPFRIAVPQADLDDLTERFSRTRFTDELSADATTAFGWTRSARW
jgi:hypothetical protein